MLDKNGNKIAEKTTVAICGKADPPGPHDIEPKWQLGTVYNIVDLGERKRTIVVVRDEGGECYIHGYAVQDDGRSPVRFEPKDDTVPAIVALDANA